jgi:pimeloyl-ACP methyl ester carboxylesterase
MGGMVSLTYAGAFPEEVSWLVVLDGVTNYPARRVKPADVRIAEWISDLDKLAQRKIHRYASVADGAERILHRTLVNKPCAERCVLLGQTGVAASAVLPENAAAKSQRNG